MGQQHQNPFFLWLWSHHSKLTSWEQAVGHRAVQENEHIQHPQRKASRNGRTPASAPPHERTQRAWCSDVPPFILTGGLALRGARAQVSIWEVGQHHCFFNTHSFARLFIGDGWSLRACPAPGTVLGGRNPRTLPWLSHWPWRKWLCVWDPQNAVPLGVQTYLGEPPITSPPPSQPPSRSGGVSGLPGLRGWCPVPPCQGRGWADCPQILGSSQNHSTSVLFVNNLQDFIVQRVLRFVFKIENPLFYLPSDLEGGLHVTFLTLRQSLIMATHLPCFFF